MTRYDEIKKELEINEWAEIKPTREEIIVAVENWVQGYKGICLIDEDDNLIGETWTTSTVQNPDSTSIIVCEVTDKDVDFSDDQLYFDFEIEALHKEYGSVPCLEESANFLGFSIEGRLIMTFLNFLEV